VTQPQRRLPLVETGSQVLQGGTAAALPFGGLTGGNRHVGPLLGSAALIGQKCCVPLQRLTGSPYTVIKFWRGPTTAYQLWGIMSDFERQQQECDLLVYLFIYLFIYFNQNAYWSLHVPLLVAFPAALTLSNLQRTTCCFFLNQQEKMFIGI